MEGKNKFNTYVVSFDYPSSYSSVFLGNAANLLI